MDIFSQFEENLEIEDRNLLTGIRQYFVTSRDKNNITKDEFTFKSFITINEMNHILENHHAVVKAVSLDYYSKNCIVVTICFNDDGSENAAPAATKQKKEFPNISNFEKDNLTMEDGRVLNGDRIYCITSQKKVNLNRETYWNNQYITLNEINHILSCHNAVIKSFIPVYKTGTEAFVHVHFSDDPGSLSFQNPTETKSSERKTKREILSGFREIEDDLTIEDAKILRGARIYCITSNQKNNLTKEYFFRYGYFSENEYLHIKKNHNCVAEEVFAVHHEVPCYFAVLEFDD